MKIKIYALLIILIIEACTTKQTPEVSSTTSIDSTQNTQETESDGKHELSATSETKDSDKIVLSEANLIQYPFVFSNSVAELIFSENGKVSLYQKIDGESNIGNWKLSGSAIQIAFEQDTVQFQIESFTRDKLLLRTGNELTEKLFNVRKMDWGEYSGYYVLDLHRLIFSPPFMETQVSGSWQVGGGACDFKQAGEFIYGDIDCDAAGTWEFDGQNFTLRLPQNNSCWQTYFGTSLKVLRLSNEIMITKDESGGILLFRRSP